MLQALLPHSCYRLLGIHALANAMLRFDGSYHLQGVYRTLYRQMKDRNQVFAIRVHRAVHA